MGKEDEGSDANTNNDKDSCTFSDHKQYKVQLQDQLQKKNLHMVHVEEIDVAESEVNNLKQTL